MNEQEKQDFKKLLNEKFRFNFYGSEYNTLIKLQKIFKKFKQNKDGIVTPQVWPYGQYHYHYSDFENNEDEALFCFVVSYMVEKQLIEYGTSIRNGWTCCDDKENQEYDGALLIKAFQELNVEEIYDILNKEEIY